MIKENPESAVSEVIGIVLVVALTVIMAALVAAYLFGMLNGISPTRTVAVTVDQPDTSHIIVTYRGGPDAGSFSYGTVSITDVAGTVVAAANCANSTHAATTILGGKIGSTVTCTGTTDQFAGKEHVVVAARFSNNVNQVVLDTLV
jgi:archaeal type IV pilus assembly protein PilA